MNIRLGTRGSVLARAQSEWVADLLREQGHEVTLVEIRTDGDVRPDSLARLGGTGVFAAALREALLEGACDIAVHSCKDLPTAPVPGLVIGAVPPRERVDDVLCARDGLTLDALPAGSRVGTGSPRRAAQLRALRPDVELVDIRGNVGTRLARVAAGDLDAVVLAGAGLARLGQLEAVTDSLPIVPAPAQGALAVECRSDDAAFLAVLATLDDASTRWCVDLERAVLARLGAGCAAPVGVHARAYDGQGTVQAVVVAVDGSDAREVNRAVDLREDPVRAGAAVAERLLELGAADITDLHAAKAPRATHSESLWGSAAPLAGLRVLLPMPLGDLADAVGQAGGEVVGAELARTVVDESAVEAARADLDAAWVVLSSARTADLLGEALAGRRVAAVGKATAGAARRVGADVALVPADGGGAAALLAVFPDAPAAADGAADEARRVVLPGSAIAAPTLADGLTARGWTVVPHAVYTTESLPLTEPLPVDVAVATAGSTARALAGSDLPVVALGEPSAQAAASVGLRVVGTCAAPTPDSLVAALVAAREEIR